MPDMELTPYHTVNAALAELRAGIAAALGAELVGLYVVGSLALGDFDLAASDIDYICVTEAAIDGARWSALAALHERFAAGSSPWANRLDAVYAPRAALNVDDTPAERYPTVEHGTGLEWAALESGWVFQRYSLREHGLVVVGPPPRTLVGVVDAAGMRAAVAAIAGRWHTQAGNDPEWLRWLAEPPNLRFVVATLCRMLFSLKTGRVASKPAALRWATAALPPRYAALGARCLALPAASPDDVAAALGLIAYTTDLSR